MEGSNSAFEDKEHIPLLTTCASPAWWNVSTASSGSTQSSPSSRALDGHTAIDERHRSCTGYALLSRRTSAADAPPLILLGVCTALKEDIRLPLILLWVRTTLREDISCRCILLVVRTALRMHCSRGRNQLNWVYGTPQSRFFRNIGRNGNMNHG